MVFHDTNHLMVILSNKVKSNKSNVRNGFVHKCTKTIHLQINTQMCQIHQLSMTLSAGVDDGAAPAFGCKNNLKSFLGIVPNTCNNPSL